MSKTQPPMSTRHDQFGFEVLKLLLQVAWADDEIADEEAEALLRLARGAHVHEEHVEELRTYLSGEVPLPPPNLALLKAEKTAVLRAVRKMVEADPYMAKEGDEVLRQISEMLV